MSLRRTACHRHERVDRTARHSLVLFFSNVYCFFDPPVHFVAFSIMITFAWSQSMTWLRVMAYVVCDGWLVLFCVHYSRLFLDEFLHFNRVFQPTSLFKYIARDSLMVYRVRVAQKSIINVNRNVWNWLRSIQFLRFISILYRRHSTAKWRYSLTLLPTRQSEFLGPVQPPAHSTLQHSCVLFP